MNVELVPYLEGLGFREVVPRSSGWQVTSPDDLTPLVWSMAWHACKGNLHLVAKGNGSEKIAGSDLSAMASKADRLLQNALDMRASDLHLEPSERALRVRFRLDGHLVNQPAVAAGEKDALVAHLKIRAGMDIAERRRPQDGRLTLHHRNRNVDMRVSTLPTQYGEKMVLRVLDKVDIQLNLSALGMPDEQRELLERAIAKPHGFVLVTGPTGSGKTTTLYACLEHIQCDTLNIMTIEDPIEYRLEGINQTQVKPEIGVDFAAALRTFLRQDPNVIMVGEIRDRETAELAMRASLTGHLVLSTLHANDACAAIPRLLDMGLPANLLSGSLSLTMAQRLLRKKCHHCHDQAGASNPNSSRPGCTQCLGTGYHGRIGVFEVLPIDDTINQAIQTGAGLNQIRALAKAKGFTSLQDAAQTLVASGLTTHQEFMREVMV